MKWTPFLVALLAILATAGLAACGGCRGSGAEDAPSRVEPDPSAGDGALAGGGDAGADSGRALARATARAALAAGTYDGPLLGAMNMQTSVMSVPAWPEDDAGAMR